MENSIININGEKYIKVDPLSEDYVLVRGDRSGIQFGIIKEANGNHFVLTKARRIWYWDGAASLSQLSTDGPSKPENCKFCVELQEQHIFDVIEMIKCTEKAVKKIKAVKEWRE